MRELARKAGVAANTVSRFENGFGAMVETLARIQDAPRRQALFSSGRIRRDQVSAFAKRRPIKLSEDGHVEGQTLESSWRAAFAKRR